MQEYELYQYWEYYSRVGKALYCRGHRLRVIEPGTLNLRRGPDFNFARFELDGVVYCGDVELHITPEDWYVHGHHLDRAYGNVVLHLVARIREEDGDTVFNNYRDKGIPTLVLPLDTAVSKNIQNLRKCDFDFSGGPELQKILEQLALRRFERKVQRFLHHLQSIRYEVLLHRHLLRSLGYSGNECAFEKLAHLIPISLIEHLREDMPMLYAVCAGQAAFLEDTPEDSFTHLLNRYYKDVAAGLERHRMENEEWNFAGLRAVNHPHFRLAGWAFLVHQHGLLDLSDHITSRLRERQDFTSTYSELNRIFRIPVSGYWRSHRSLGIPAAKTVQFFFSEHRIAEFLINVIIPLETAEACLQESHGYVGYLRDFYLWMPRLNIYASLVGRFPKVKTYPKERPGHALNQALIYLKDEFCRSGNCISCPLRTGSIKKIDIKIKNI